MEKQKKVSNFSNVGSGLLKQWMFNICSKFSKNVLGGSQTVILDKNHRFKGEKFWWQLKTPIVGNQTLLTYWFCLWTFEGHLLAFLPFPTSTDYNINPF